MDNTSESLKRKRSPSAGTPAPAAKTPKTGGQLSINYIARHNKEDLPLINKDDNLPNLLHLLSCYNNVLDRHESLASNLGARPLGPNLIKRFERCFESAPKIVASHVKSSGGGNEDHGRNITWLEVIEFARSHPTQFTLSTFSEGSRVCQFYYPQKQLRVQVSEEDFLFINSGRCQDLIPPLPIWEDEEKEVGTCDILDAKLKELTNAADMIAARTRQLCHRLKGRKAAILERRAEGGSGTPAKASALQTTTAPPLSTSSGFTAANSGVPRSASDSKDPSTIRSDLLKHFESLSSNRTPMQSHSRHQSIAGQFEPPQHVSRQLDAAIHMPPIDGRSNASSLSPVPPSAFPGDNVPYDMSSSRANPNNQNHVSNHRPSSSAEGHPNASGQTPLSKHNFSRPLPPDLESSQPFRPLCQAHMDSLQRGTRVLPPCDRCRRLRMDCVKNLTSCQGCTKKHARCHWREVSRDELGALDHLMDAAYNLESPLHESSARINGFPNGDGHSDDAGNHRDDSEDDDDSNPLEDLEALGQKEEQEYQLAEESSRNDETGMTHPRALARSGAAEQWEESLKSAQQSHLPSIEREPPQVNSVRRASNHKVDVNPGAERVSGSVDLSVDSPRATAKRHSYDPVHDDIGHAAGAGRSIADQASPTPAGISSTHGGFRPFNDTHHAVSSGHGWRDM